MPRVSRSACTTAAPLKCDPKRQAERRQLHLPLQADVNNSPTSCSCAIGTTLRPARMRGRAVRKKPLIPTPRPACVCRASWSSMGSAWLPGTAVPGTRGSQQNARLHLPRQHEADGQGCAVRIPNNPGINLPKIPKLRISHWETPMSGAKGHALEETRVV